MITARIDLNKVDESKVYAGKDGARWLDIVMFDSKPTNYGDYRDKQTHMICQSVSKEERLAGKRGAILGNGTELGSNRDRRPPAPPAESTGEKPINPDDVPF